MTKKLSAKGVLPALAVTAVIVFSFFAARGGLLGSSSTGYGYGYGYGCGYGYSYAYSCPTPTPTPPPPPPPVSVAPVVTGVSPTSGPTSGGTTLTISGSLFTGATAVKFGTLAAASFTVNSDSSITAVSPAEPAGTVDITVTTANGTSATSAADQFTFTGGVYHAMAPSRLLDTRTSGQRLAAGGSLNLTVTGGNVPNNASAVVLNVTVTNTFAPGFLTVYPAGVTRPLASNLNWAAGQTVPNLVVVGVGTNGQVTIFSNSATDVVVDIEGYDPTSTGPAGTFFPLTPARITDTRPSSGQPNAGGTLGAGSTIDVQVTGAGGIPLTGVAAVALNATVTNTSRSSFLTAYPTGTARPLASNLNWVAGQVVPNRVMVPVGTGGKVTFYNLQGSADLVIDVNGYFADSTSATSGFSYTSLTPARILDTRLATAVGAGGTLVVTVAGQGGVPASGAQGVVLNVTVTDTTAASFLTVWPDGTGQPLASDLNWVTGQTVPNLVVVKLGSTGKVDVFNHAGSTDVVIDVVGWYG